VPDATARVELNVLAFEDTGSTTRNPRKRNIAWEQSIGPITVAGAKTDSPDDLAPGATATLFSTAVSISADASTDYTLSAPLGAPVGHYRLTWGTHGAAPAFRTARTVVLAGRTATLTVNPDSTVTVSLDSTTPFGAVQAGDTALIPGVSTYDAPGPFDPLNEGRWTVLSTTSATVVLARPAGSVWQGVSQSVAIPADSAIRFFSAAGVQPGDKADFSSGFPSSIRHAYPVTAVAPDYIEFDSPQPLPVFTVTPGAAALQIYRGSRSFVLVVATQEVDLTINGQILRLTPQSPGDVDAAGFHAHTGPVWSLSVTNRSSATAELTVMSWR
jgi:hypothetical protein